MNKVESFRAQHDFPCWCGERKGGVFCRQMFGRRHFVVVECAACKTQRILPRALNDQAAAETLYNEYAGTEVFDIDAKRLLEIMRRRFLDVQINFARDTRVLDVGCGSGQLIEGICEAFGCVGKGIDVDRRGIAKAKARSHHATFECGLFDPSMIDGKYDIVLSSAVVEHVTEPVTFLKRHAEALRHGGSLYVSTPNAASLNYWALRSWWRDLLSIGEHIYLFTPESLSHCAQGAGLELVSAASDFDWERTSFRFDTVRNVAISLWAFYRGAVKRVCARVAKPMKRDILYAHFKRV